MKCPPFGIWTLASIFSLLSVSSPSLGRDLTFFVLSDTHADPTESYDLRAISKTINKVGKGGQWPSEIGGKKTNFVGGKISEPRGVVLTGDITGWGTAPTEIQTFRRYFEAGASADAIKYPAYIGLGNHDIDPADRPADKASEYRKQYWAYVDKRHKGPNAPVKVKAFDSKSHSYSWDWDGVHFVQTHRFVGDTDFGLASNVDFVESDLNENARDEKPVIFFQHYGMDSFGTQERWWTSNERSAYRRVIDGYNVAGIFAGHTHFAMNYTWEGKRVFQVNNAKDETGKGNKDGKGSFAIVRITDKKINIVTCRWLDDTGRYELIAPFISADL